MGKPKYFIALDIGTTFVKGALLDMQSHTLLHVQRMPFPSASAKLPPHFFEVAPTALVTSVRHLLEKLLSVAPDCQGIVTSTQMHSLVLTDLDHRPLTNVITWRDQRALSPHPSGRGSFYDHLLERLAPEEQTELGGGLRAGLPVGALFWMAESNRLPRQQSIPLTLSEFVFTQICKTLQTPGVDPTNAAAYGTFNLQTGNWHEGVLEKLGLHTLRWPDIASFHSITGYLEHKEQQIPCYGSVGDHQCALAGAFVQPNELSLNVATGSQVSFITPRLSLGNYETRPYFDGQFLNTVVKLPAGRSLSLLVELLSELANLAGYTLNDPWKLIEEAVARTPQSDLQIDLSFYDSAEGRAGSITNVREDNLSVGHVFRTAFDTMADNYHRYAAQIAGEDGVWDRIVFSGGLVTKMDALRQAIIDRFGCDYRLCKQDEDALFGLLTLAMTISREASSVTDAATILVREENASSESDR